MPSNLTDENDKPIKAAALPAGYWEVIQHRTGSRGAVLDLLMVELKAQGFEFYRPMTQVKKQPMINGKRSTTLQWVNEPLFPGYMFVHRLKPGTIPLHSIKGVEGGFMGGVRPAVIEALRAKEDDGLIRLLRENDPDRDKIEEGDEVETIDGFIRAVVTQVFPSGRLMLLSRFMGGSRMVVSLAEVVRIESAETKAAREREEKARIKAEKAASRAAARK